MIKLTKGETMKHTKGPWKVSGHTLEDGTRGVVINVKNDYQNVIAFNVFVRDASLIAAAPELLEACQEAAIYIAGRLIAEGKEGSPMLDQLQKAIAKAEPLTDQEEESNDD